MTTITKEHLNRCIQSMDNNQRRLLAQNPDRTKISQAILDKMAEERQAAKARRLSALRFGTCSTDTTLSEPLDPVRVDGSIQLSDALMESVMELLSGSGVPMDDIAASAIEKPTAPAHTEDDEIVVLPPPPKVPPPCIDLDCDDNQPVAPIKQPVATEEKKVPVTKTDEKGVKPLPPSAPPPPSDQQKLVPMEVDPQPASAHNFLLEDLKREGLETRERIAIIDQEIEKLMEERKALTMKEAELKQQLFDAIRSGSTVNLTVHSSPKVFSPVFLFFIFSPIKISIIIFRSPDLRAPFRRRPIPSVCRVLNDYLLRPILTPFQRFRHQRWLP